MIARFIARLTCGVSGSRPHPIAAVVAAATTVAVAGFHVRAQTATTVITHVTVIDGSGAPPQRNVTVTIRNDRIAGIGQPTGDRTSSTELDGDGRFLIPGLWDMHVHLTEITEVACPALVARGVTGARDMGGDLALIDWMRDRISAGDLIGPTIFRAGVPVTSGRTYAGGLTKFEPTEMERLLVPDRPELNEGESSTEL